MKSQIYHLPEGIDVPYYQDHWILKLLLNGYSGITWFGKICLKPKYKVTDQFIRHEYIHILQSKELGMLRFYILYLYYWIRNLVKKPKTAYRSVPFEMESYLNQRSKTYIATRPKNNWKIYK
jgi:hypothetical protein